MVKLNKIYTRTGDGGPPAWWTAPLAKSILRMTAIGKVDEANAAIGVASPPRRRRQRAALLRVQNELFDLGADVATPGEVDGALAHLASAVARLEHEIDAMNAHSSR